MMRRSIVVMGVSGSGKSTIGQKLAAKLGGRFVDADDLHPAENITHMKAGHPLTDEMRRPWLTVCGDALAAEPTVLACSALKRTYRDQMRGDVPDLLFVYLDGSYDQIAARLTKRRAHFMPQTLLDSQFEALEPPTSDERALSVGIADSADQIVKTILDELADLGA